jgi:hypothetical protein
MTHREPRLSMCARYSCRDNALTLYHTHAGRGERPANLAEESLPKNIAWIDLLKPEPDEVGRPAAASSSMGPRRVTDTARISSAAHGLKVCEDSPQPRCRRRERAGTRALRRPRHRKM